MAPMSPDAETGMPAKPNNKAAYLLAGLARLVLQATVLRSFGQPWIAASGHILFWVGDPFSPDTSQQLTDWYSFTHLVHGMVIFWLLRMALPGLPLPMRFLAAMGIEIAWEITENTPAVIQHYRQQAL